MTVESNWISVGDLADGFAPNSNILPLCFDLADIPIKLVFEDKTEQELKLEHEGDMLFLPKESTAPIPVRVTSLRPDLYFIDYLTANESVTLLINRQTGQALKIIGTLPTIDEATQSLLARAQSGLPLTCVKVKFLAGHIAGMQSKDGFERTSDLVGKRIRYRYSLTELYEHIYLNDAFYSWHCLKGVEAGLADTDRCHYFKLQDQLYLFVWQEKIVPTLGVVTIDLNRNKTDGKIFGHSDFASGVFSNFPVGAFATFANYTPPDLGA